MFIKIDSTYSFNTTAIVLSFTITATIAYVLAIGISIYILFRKHTSSHVSSSPTTTSCPHSAANNSGVVPYLFSEFGLILPYARSSFTTASCPFSAANDSGIYSQLKSLKFILTPSYTSSNFTTALYLLLVANNNSIRPKSFFKGKDVNINSILVGPKGVVLI